MAKDTQEYPELLTVTEFSRILRCDPATVRRWIKSGALEAITLPGNEKQQYRIRKETLEKLLRTRL